MPTRQLFSVPNQFGDSSLSTAEAYSACGPAAAVAFAQYYGRNPTLREATDIAKSVGWTEANGMAGAGSEKALLQKMGVNATLDPSSNWARIQATAAAGQPVMISTAAHYFAADAYDSASGAYHVGQSGLALRGGSEWMTRAQIEQRGAANGALYVDSGNEKTLLDSVGNAVAGLGVTTASAAGPETDPIDTYIAQAQADEAANAAIGSRPPDTSSSADSSASGAAPATSTYIERINAAKGNPTKTQTNAKMLPDTSPTGRALNSVTPNSAQVPNPNPQYRYTWPDGTYAVVNASDEILGGNALADISKGTATANLSRFTGPDGYSYIFDPNTGETVRDESVGTAAPKADTAPPSIVSVGGKAFKWQKGRDGAWALYPVAELNDPNYQPPGYRTPAQQAQDSATLTGTNINNQQGQMAILKAQAQAKADAIWADPNIAPQDKISNFDEWWKVTIDAPQARASLVKTIQDQQTAYINTHVGAGYGAAMSAALKAGATGVGAGDVNWPTGAFSPTGGGVTEDPNAIAERMTLQALQGISPLAAHRLSKLTGQPVAQPVASANVPIPPYAGVGATLAGSVPAQPVVPPPALPAYPGPAGFNPQAQPGPSAISPATSVPSIPAYAGPPGYQPQAQPGPSAVAPIGQQSAPMPDPNSEAEAMRRYYQQLPPYRPGG